MGGPVICTASAMMNELIEWRNPQGQEINWYGRPARGIDNYGDFVFKVAVAQAGFLVCTLVALIETVVYVALWILLLPVCCFANGTFAHVSFLCDSAMFTIIWSIFDTILNPLVINMFTRESYARNFADNFNLCCISCNYSPAFAQEVRDFHAAIRDRDAPPPPPPRRDPPRHPPASGGRGGSAVGVSAVGAASTSGSASSSAAGVSATAPPPPALTEAEITAAGVDFLVNEVVKGFQTAETSEALDAFKDQMGEGFDIMQFFVRKAIFLHAQKPSTDPVPEYFQLTARGDILVLKLADYTPNDFRAVGLIINNPHATVNDIPAASVNARHLFETLQVVASRESNLCPLVRKCWTPAIARLNGTTPS